ncbi:MAG: hypothetical protein ACOY9D_09245 [Pseudomonadota bacterium]
MYKPNNVVALVLALSLMLATGAADARFYRSMTAQQITQEVMLWLMSGMSLDEIAKSTHQTGLKSEQVASSLIQSGQNPAAVVTALSKVDPEAAILVTVEALTLKPAQAAEITAAAIAASPKQSREIIQEALTVPGVNPTDILSATAAGASEVPGEGH